MTLLQIVTQIIEEEMEAQGLARLQRVARKSGPLAGGKVFVRSIEGEDGCTDCGGNAGGAAA